MKPVPAFVLSLCALLLLSAVGLLWGSVEIAPAEAWRALTGTDSPDNPAAFIVRESRLPQVATALLSGAALAVAGLLMQTLFANPLADPSILGTNAGAGLGVALAMLLLGGSATVGSLTMSGFFLIVSAALAGALAVTFLLLLLSMFLRGRLMLLITGVMVSYLVSAVISILNFYATAQGVHSYMLWGMGDFTGVTLDRLPAYALTLGLALCAAMLAAKPLNALLLGERYAANLGVRIRRTRTLLLLATCLLSATVTALCGPIAFIGLAVPHGARLLLRTSDHRVLLPATALWGANVALLCNLLSHLPASGSVLPVNALTPLIGVPVVLYILLRKPE